MLDVVELSFVFFLEKNIERLSFQSCEKLSVQHGTTEKHKTCSANESCVEKTRVASCCFFSMLLPGQPNWSSGWQQLTFFLLATASPAAPQAAQRSTQEPPGHSQLLAATPWMVGRRLITIMHHHHDAGCSDFSLLMMR